MGGTFAALKVNSEELTGHAGVAIRKTAAAPSASTRQFEAIHNGPHLGSRDRRGVGLPFNVYPPSAAEIWSISITWKAATTSTPNLRRQGGSQSYDPVPDAPTEAPTPTSPLPLRTVLSEPGLRPIATAIGRNPARTNQLMARCQLFRAGPVGGNPLLSRIPGHTVSLESERAPGCGDCSLQIPLMRR